MFKVKYSDTIEPQDFEEEFEMEQEAVEWIDREMSIWRDVLYDKYPDLDVTWLNRFLDCGDTTTIYVPDTSIEITCTFIEM